MRLSTQGKESDNVRRRLLSAHQDTRVLQRTARSSVNNRCLEDASGSPEYNRLAASQGSLDGETQNEGVNEPARSKVRGLFAADTS
jgi:hypothetical protein